MFIKFFKYVKNKINFYTGILPRIYGEELARFYKAGHFKTTFHQSQPWN